MTTGCACRTSSRETTQSRLQCPGRFVCTWPRRSPACRCQRSDGSLETSTTPPCFTRSIKSKDLGKRIVNSTGSSKRLSIRSSSYQQPVWTCCGNYQGYGIKQNIHRKEIL